MSKPFNELHDALGRGRWCKCGVPIWRRGDAAPDRREVFDSVRATCRVCALRALTSAWVVDEEQMRRDLAVKSGDADFQALQDAVALSPFDESGDRREARQRWGASNMTQRAANDYVPLADIWKERFAPAIGSSTVIGYRARHVLDVTVRVLSIDGIPNRSTSFTVIVRRLPFYPLDCGFARRGEFERSFNEVRDAPDSDMGVTDAPRHVDFSGRHDP